MSEKEIYVVTEGSYSDYHICGVFTNKEKAENFVNIYNKYSGDYAEKIAEDKLAEWLAERKGV